MKGLAWFADSCQQHGKSSSSPVVVFVLVSFPSCSFDVHVVSNVWLHASVAGCSRADKGRHWADTRRMCADRMLLVRSLKPHLI